ncbi:MAG TPA: MFS transporter [Candidatus Atribacteria bacterium]|nr:MFS transporter [Candidatus Atribacteria bacterium]
MLSRRDYLFNFVVDTLDYSFFSLGMSFGSTVTLLPLLAQRLGASNLEIGLIPAIAYLGWSFPAIWGARVSGKLEKKLPFILRFTLFERLPFLGMALLAFYLVPHNPSLSLYILFILLGINSFAMGFLGPIWTEMIGKVIHHSRWGLYFACGNGLGALMGMWGSTLAERFISTYPFPRNFGYCFLLASVSMVISYFFIALTREEKEEVTSSSGEKFLSSFFQVIREDANFLSFLLARIFLALGVVGGAFYTVYALQKFIIPDALVARYNAVLLVSQALSNFIWGPLGDKKGHKLVVLLGATSIVLSNLLALFSPDFRWFFLAFTLLGFNYSAISVGGTAIVLDFAPREKRGLYVGWSSFLSNFPAFFSPILGGKIADRFGYHWVFWLALSLNLVGLLWILWGVREPRAFTNFEEG